MKLNHLFLIVIGIFSLSFQSISQPYENEKFRFAFYNVENFFDIHIDTTRDYNAFTPEGEQRWTFHRYIKKRNDMYRVIMALGGWEAPTLVGLCEVENEIVLGDLIYKTPLRNANYSFVHYYSPDFRGIDVALIYRKDHLRLINSIPIPVIDPRNPNFKTRDILYASFSVSEEDTVHVYVNHWPSRFGGMLASVPRRMLAALTLRKHVDSLMLVKPHAKIVIMGDFNDTPRDDSIIKGLRAFDPKEVTKPDDLVHLFTNADVLGHLGTLKFQHMWQIFDHIIVSQSLVNDREGLIYKEGSASIFKADFLLTDDERYLGKKVNRTFVGPRYTGGYSDHLPVFIDLEYKETE
jgi:endonuclease/exonuclease/phosphatase family metal-dependent hydrolase